MADVLVTTPHPSGSNDASGQILRFHPSERLIHWVVALPFMICWTTALILVVFYNLHPERAYRTAVSWTHRLSGFGLLALPVWTLTRSWADFRLHVHNVREAWRWSVDDLKWVLLKGPAAMSSRIRLPDQGKFNAGEKINFMILTASYPVYIVTGLLIWTHQYAFPAWVVHLTLAAVATPLMLGHIYLATLNRDTRPGLSGMVSGLVDRGWAAHHYAHWYRRHFAEQAGDGAPTAARAPDVDAAQPPPESAQ